MRSAYLNGSQEVACRQQGCISGEYVCACVLGGGGVVCCESGSPCKIFHFAPWIAYIISTQRISWQPRSHITMTPLLLLRPCWILLKASIIDVWSVATWYDSNYTVALIYTCKFYLLQPVVTAWPCSTAVSNFSIISGMTVMTLCMTVMTLCMTVMTLCKTASPRWSVLISFDNMLCFSGTPHNSYHHRLCQWGSSARKTCNCDVSLTPAQSNMQVQLRYTQNSEIGKKMRLLFVCQDGSSWHDTFFSL